MTYPPPELDLVDQQLAALWGCFFSAKTRLDFVSLRVQHPIMSQAVDALEGLSKFGPLE
jgi:hypothetical protein